VLVAIDWRRLRQAVVEVQLLDGAAIDGERETIPADPTRPRKVPSDRDFLEQDLAAAARAPSFVLNRFIPVTLWEAGVHIAPWIPRNAGYQCALIAVDSHARYIAARDVIAGASESENEELIAIAWEQLEEDVARSHRMPVANA